MSDGYYMLDAEHNAVPVDLGTWANMLEGKFEDNRRVAETTVPGFWISTVFLGLDHNWDIGPPLLFETMIFSTLGKRRKGDIFMDRYSTWDQAVAGHAWAVKHCYRLVALHYWENAWYGLRRYMKNLLRSLRGKTP